MPALRPSIVRRKPDSRTSAALDEFVERLALSLESDVLPRIAGRIFALLILGEPANSLEGIVLASVASKASASVITRFLEQRGLIERVSLQGD
jgi:DNA-binding transcriptional regulator GbsR (MarR family)